MHLWYRGFEGAIEEVSAGKYKVSGLWNKVNDTTLVIEVLPIGSWTQPYKEFLEELRANPEKASIKDYKEFHTDTTVHFEVEFSTEQMEAAEQLLPVWDSVWT